MPDPQTPAARLQSLRSAIGGSDLPLLIAIHDYPDPDAIAAAIAMQTLVASWGVNAPIAHGGVLGREENSEMARLLKIEMKTFDALPDSGAFRGALLLDTQPAAKNHSLPRAIPVFGVIDHHSPGEASRETAKAIFSDVRPAVGATSTMMLGYLEEAGLTPDSRLATALFLGIKTDTDGLLRTSCPDDIHAYTALLPLADLATAARVIHPPLDRDHFQFMHLVMEKAAVYGATLIADCGEVKTPDMLSTASDALIHMKDINYALAVGFRAGRASLSLRAKAPHVDATRVLLHVVGSEGKGGGHGLSAGGFIDTGGDEEKWRHTIRTRLLEATGDGGFSKETIIQ